MSKVTTYVAALPDCDFCPAHPVSGKKRKAKYDFKTSWGPWAYGCKVHWINNRAHTELGTGWGQELIEGEEPERTDDDIQQDVNAAIASGDYDALEEALGDRDFAEFM